MGCEDNKFCSNLTVDDRERLCQTCSKRVYKKNQVLMREDYMHKLILLLDGAMVSRADFTEDRFDSQDVPGFFLSTRNTIFPCEMIFRREAIPKHNNNFMLCLSDCTAARLDLDTVKDLFMTSSLFAQELFQNQQVVIMQACEFSVTIRSSNVYRSVRYLLDFLSSRDVWLSHEQIAIVTGHNRSSVTKAITKIRTTEPEYWSSIQPHIN